MQSVFAQICFASCHACRMLIVTKMHHWTQNPRQPQTTQDGPVEYHKCPCPETWKSLNELCLMHANAHESAMQSVKCIWGFAQSIPACDKGSAKLTTTAQFNFEALRIPDGEKAMSVEQIIPASLDHRFSYVSLSGTWLQQNPALAQRSLSLMQLSLFDV